MRTCGWLRKSYFRCFILWNLLQSQGNAQKWYFWYPLLYWNTSLFTRMACAQESKGLHKPSPRQVVWWGNFIQKTTAGPSHSYSHPLRANHTVNISFFLPQALSTDISPYQRFLAQKSSHDSFLSLSRSLTKCRLLRNAFIDHSIQSCTSFQPKWLLPSFNFPPSTNCLKFYCSVICLYISCLSLSQLESEFWSTNYVLFKAKFSTTTIMTRIYIAFHK